MDRKKLTPYLLTFSLIVASALLLAAPASAQRTLDVTDPEADQPIYGLVVEVQPVRTSYTLGEIVRLVVRMTNRSGEEIRLPDEPTVENGRLRIFVAEGDERFREYLGPGWSLEDAVGAPEIVLAPGGSLETDATLLFNFQPETAHLSPLYVRQIHQARVGSDYVFDRPGLYRLKAVVDLGDAREEVGSDPVHLNIRRPQGADLEVWNVLKEDAELGHFLQAGTPKGDPLSERSLALAETLASLANSHPDSRLALEIRSSLARYRSTVELLRALRVDGTPGGEGG